MWRRANAEAQRPTRASATPATAARLSLVSLVTACAAATMPGVALAQSEAYHPSSFEETPATRRSGFLFGVTAGVYAGQAQGYPNDVSQIDRPEYFVNTKLGASSGAVLWLGGALTDWFSFGLGVGFGGINGQEQLVAGGTAFLMRIETFPLFYQGGGWEDVGVLLNAGTGAFTVKDGDETVAEGAGTSVIGVGTFYEPLRVWQLSMGPALEYSHHFSQSIKVHTALLGWRTVFYGGP